MTCTAATVERIESRIKTAFRLEALALMLTRVGDLKLHSIRVPKSQRGSGKGSAAMQAICDFADACRLRIILDPAGKNDDGTTSRARLVRFYKRFGFVENKGRQKDFAVAAGMYRPVALSGDRRKKP